MEAQQTMYSNDFQSFAGPGDRDLPMSEVSGYQPVSRIGEVVMNAFGKAFSFPTPRPPCPPTVFQMKLTAANCFVCSGRVRVCAA